MQQVGTKYKTKLAELSKRPIFIATFEGIPTRFSTEIVQNPLTILGSSTVKDIMENPSGAGSQTTVIEGTTSISNFSFSLLDKNLAVTKIMLTYPIPNRKVTVKMGFAGMDEAEYATLFVGTVLDFTLENDNVSWKFTLNDQMVRPKQFVFNAFALLTADISSSDTTIPVTSTGRFKSSTGTKDYIVIDQEIIAYTGVTPTSFTGCVRGALGTIIVAHANGAQANNYIVLQDNALNIALQILTSTGLGTNGAYDVLTAEQGLGIPQANIDVKGFERQRNLWLNVMTFRFELAGKEDAKKFLEEEIYKFTNSYSFINNNGQISIHVYEPPMGQNGLATLTDDNIVGAPTWKGNILQNFFFNEVDIQYDYNTIQKQFLTESLYENATSQAKYNGLVKTLAMKSRGMSTAVTGVSRVNKIARRILKRFADPTPIIKAKTFMSQRLIEIGDIVNFTTDKIPDIARGVQGIKNQLAEVISVNPDYKEGSVTFDVLNTGFSFGKKYAVISPSTKPPTNFPKFPAATAAQRLYAFISKKVNATYGVMSDNSDGYYLTP